MSKKNKRGRPRKYDFSRIRKGVWVSVKCDNLHSCRESAKYWANKNGYSVITRQDGDKILIYRI